MRNDLQNGQKVASNEQQPVLTRARARTLNKLISTAMDMLEQGWFPSITELANAAGVSRATAYRYFPTQSVLVSSIVDESLGPIQEWAPQENTVGERISALLEFAYPQLEKHEGALRAALQVSLQQWADLRSQKLDKEKDQSTLFVRGNRKRLVELAAEPMKDKVASDDLERMKHAFSLIYGSEVFLVFKDIWNLDSDQIQDVVQWMGKAIVRQVEEDAGIKN
ncbi:TetR/AcrR family transcriptional regulator [Pragia fontium]|uniref:Transcriptional regulator, TetR family n=2 Tax=Pragia fontium TaxID=82985 RepID=A0AAJ5BHS3_9GAMM|nr:TetR/AcrR family transcriptional regulator [Pragia fontium]AKJ42949.1 TetR family transcriptional regulator [Pragia fontium]SFD06491.1 transcriptional regulator, TetR family [Pragia fontium DSM 5563 = ATCC 49100]SUB83368.1 mycofactocin system transcriptional regulator [Pragia fontium]VEJ56263.1 mycofactocin system transcriptional regulator [Pragia fontium]GKX63948.1 TetR family transcriptional regulator [Pragia fontium]